MDEDACVSKCAFSKGSECVRDTVCIIIISLT